MPASSGEERHSVANVPARAIVFSQLGPSFPNKRVIKATALAARLHMIRGADDVFISRIGYISENLSDPVS
jgi:hypothetical protein